MAGHSGFGEVANFSAPGFIRSIKTQVDINQVAEKYLLVSGMEKNDSSKLL